MAVPPLPGPAGPTLWPRCRRLLSSALCHDTGCSAPAAPTAPRGPHHVLPPQALWPPRRAHPQACPVPVLVPGSAVAMSPVVLRGCGRIQRRDSRELRLCMVRRERGWGSRAPSLAPSRRCSPTAAPSAVPRQGSATWLCRHRAHPGNAGLPRAHTGPPGTPGLQAAAPGTPGRCSHRLAVLGAVADRSGDVPREPLGRGWAQTGRARPRLRCGWGALGGPSETTGAGGGPAARWRGQMGTGARCQRRDGACHGTSDHPWGWHWESCLGMGMGTPRSGSQRWQCGCGCCGGHRSHGEVGLGTRTPRSVPGMVMVTAGPGVRHSGVTAHRDQGGAGAVPGSRYGGRAPGLPQCRYPQTPARGGSAGQCPPHGAVAASGNCCTVPEHCPVPGGGVPGACGAWCRGVPGVGVPQCGMCPV